MPFHVHRELVFSNEFVAAARDGRGDLVRRFLDEGIRPDTPNIAGGSALAMAAENGHYQIVELLLTRGATPNDMAAPGVLRGQTRKSALMRAATKGHFDILRLLIEHGALLDLQDVNGQTALIWAAAYGQLWAAKLLIEAGAATGVVDVFGHTAQMIAKEKGYADIEALCAQPQ